MDSDSSSESDDEYLTIRDKSKGNVDREALIRKKLLESFYGHTPAGAQGNVDDGAASRSEGHAATSSVKQEAHAIVSEERRNHADAKDLDSPYFDAVAHTSHHVVNSSVHQLLEMDEQLTLQVRTLDSSTQNMVYENYSKFIDATEAVKSVGVNVQANEQGLERLKRGMETINEQSRLVEEDLGSLRDAVAEKIRVKRLLTRLDALLKLPETLRGHITAGKYLTAASSFCRSTNILSKHSAGFESLQKIETECNGILLEMMNEVNRKFLYWSGQETSLAIVGSNSEDDDENQVSVQGDNNDDDELPPEPPKSISEIFECAGSLAMLVMEKPAGMNPSVSIESCKAMSMSASMRFLDRLFDTHQLEIQESMFSTIPASVVDENGAFEGDHSARSQQSHRGHHLIPTMVVDSILEAATLYRMSFSGEADDLQDAGSGPDYLMEFVMESYSSFLSHVRSILLEHSMAAQLAQDATTEDGQEGDADDVYDEVAGAMSILIHAVRELATGISLPEVGISADVAADMVERASVLNETLVRRRVEQKFCDLRLRVVNDCLVPFATRVGKNEDENDASTERSRVLQVVQIALSDSWQLLDDTVRSISSSSRFFGASAEAVDLSMLKQSIQASTVRFASWLAGTLEVLAGCESSDPTFSFEASAVRGQKDESAQSGGDGRRMVSVVADQDDLSDISNQFDPLAEKIDSAIQDLICGFEGQGKESDSLDFALKICEMCRGCERTFVDSVNQSIETNMGGKKGRSKGLFPMDNSKKNVVVSEYERRTTERFRLAASRILTLYACNRGFEAASDLCSTLSRVSSMVIEDFPKCPSDAACRALGVAKSASLDCAELFNESNHAGPPPNFSNASNVAQPLVGMNSSPLKGLQLDVERMFKEEISIYPHTSEILDLSRNAVLTMIFKVIAKAWCEKTRQCSFSTFGFNQLVVDVEFFREMIPHYIDESFQSEGSNACTSLSALLDEAVTGAAGRCFDDCADADLVRRARSVLRDFMKSNPSVSRFIISDE